ncbi:hypothetical protein Chor_012190 [Crotalus horridus]
MSLGEAKLQVPPGLELYLKENRLATFTQWPFDSDCSCTAVRMAEAGFIHCPTENASDVAQCFICCKELEGWEPDDDPIGLNWQDTEKTGIKVSLLFDLFENT